MMLRKVSLFFIFCLSALLAEEMVYQPLKGILITSSEDNLLSQKVDLMEIDGVEYNCFSLPVDKIKLANRLNSFINLPLTNELIENVKICISSFLHDKGFTAVLVKIPDQDLSYQVLQIVIEESLLFCTEIQGGRKSTKKIIKRYLALKKGKAIEEKKLLDNVNFINRNPFRKLDIKYEEGEEPYTQDVILPLTERRLFRVFAGGENNGIVPIGRQRWFGGVNFGRFLFLDQILSYQFTMATDISRFQAHTGKYTLFLPWKNQIDLYGGYSKAKKHKEPSKGTSSQASLRYIFPLPSYPNFEHDLKIGFDFKRTNNTLDLSEFHSIVAPSYVELLEFTLSYFLKYQKCSTYLDWNQEIFYAPAKLLPHQRNRYFEMFRPHAKNHWFYYKTSLYFLQKFKEDFSLIFRLMAQIASSALLQTEQVGLGGSLNVRGYDERTINKDSAFFTSLEFQSPEIKIFSASNSKKDYLKFAIFLDYALGKDLETFFTQKKFQYLASIGPGIRYELDPNISLKADWGIRLHRSEEFNNGKSRLHFSLLISY